MGNIYKESRNRKQQMFFPPSIDEYVDKDNSVRVIDEYVELLDMVELGFTKAALKSKEGQPAYHPKLLLKIYIYGYLNGIRSSRKLAKEVRRNVEMMWLCEELKPGDKTISNFRKENSSALKKVFREFVLLCKEIDLITGELTAIDGTFFKANASKNQLVTKKSIEKSLKDIDAKIEDYLTTMEFTDNKEKKERGLSLPNGKLINMKKYKDKLDADLKLLEDKEVTQYNKTDPDAKLMKKHGKSQISYNSQIAVDNNFKLITTTEITPYGNDMKELHKMAKEVKSIVGDEVNSTFVSDTGYYSANEIKKCQDDNMEVIIPVANRQKTQKDKGLYSSDDFTYDEENNCYICPNQQMLTQTKSVKVQNNDIKYYTYSAGSKICNSCPLRDNLTFAPK